MDGQFYVDTRAPHISADVASVTLATTAKAMVPVANLPVLGANYFGYVGKAVRMSAFGRMTTGATPGNGTFELLWGNGTDANGTLLNATGAMTLIANQTAAAWWFEMIIRCRALGATGSLFATGMFCCNPALVASNMQLVPNATPSTTTCDLTQANYISPQFIRSGSTAETLQVHDFLFEALN